MKAVDRIWKPLFACLLALLAASRPCAGGTVDGQQQGKIGAGAQVSAFLHSTGTLLTSGNDAFGQLGTDRTLGTTQPVQVTGLGKVIDVVASRNCSGALTEDGLVWMWGENSSRQLGDGTDRPSSTPLRIEGLDEVVDLAVGGRFSLALRSDGTVWEWGSGFSDSPDPDGYPSRVDRLRDVVQVSAGLDFGAAVTRDGRVWTWGENWAGQLGNGGFEYSPTPTPVPGLFDVASVAAGHHHVLALKADGTVYTWGMGWGWMWRWSGNRPSDGRDRTPNPRKVPLLSGIVSVAAGELHSSAVDRAGITHLWGWQPGARWSLTWPTRVTGMSGISSIEAGAWHSLAIARDGALWTWGNNESGQLGRQRDITYSGTPLVPRTLGRVRAVAGGERHTIALTEDGEVWAWGANENGQLGDGLELSSPKPNTVSELTDVKSVSVGDDFVIALKHDGSVLAWGDNEYRQLGNGTDIDSPVPVSVATLTGIVSVAAGQHHALALHEDGRVFAWGDNSSGQLLGRESLNFSPVPLEVPEIVAAKAIAAGSNHSLAVLRDGNVMVWGNNLHGQLGIGSISNRESPTLVPGIDGVVAVSAGTTHSVALRSDGTVWSWGGRSLLGNGTADGSTVPVQMEGLNDVVAVSAGKYHTIALTSEGDVWGWGSNTGNPLGQGSYLRTTPTALQELDNAMAVAAGDKYTLVLKTDGTIRGLGENSSGQLSDGTYSRRYVPSLGCMGSGIGVLDLYPEIPNADFTCDQLRSCDFEAQLASEHLDSLTDLRTGCRSRRDSSGTRAETSVINLYVAVVVPESYGEDLSGLWLKDSDGDWGRDAVPHQEISTADSGDAVVRLRALDADTLRMVNTLPGTKVYVGYGESIEQMFEEGSYRDIYQVPMDEL